MEAQELGIPEGDSMKEATEELVKLGRWSERQGWSTEVKLGSSELRKSIAVEDSQRGVPADWREVSGGMMV